nr:hypothetical protein [uncultured Halomonas sp.]
MPTVALLSVLAERTTRLVILLNVNSAAATAVATGFSDKLNQMPQFLGLPMTYVAKTEKW